MTEPAPALTIRYWGVRGSVPAPGAATARYGGNTPCVELRASDGRRLVLDAGTGLRALGDALGDAQAESDAPHELSVLVTHGHTDHVQGVPFFAPMARGRVTLAVWAAPACAAGVEGALRALAAPPLFPAGPRLADRLMVRRLDAAGETSVAGFAVATVPMAHPDDACGFVVRDPVSGFRVAYLPDNELAVVAGEGSGRRAMLEALADVDVLIHDATYLPDELATHRGWGHSSYDEAVRLAIDTGGRRLVLFHHHPGRTDDAVDRLAHVARTLAAVARGGGPEVTAAAEGAALVLEARGAPPNVPATPARR